MGIVSTNGTRWAIAAAWLTIMLGPALDGARADVVTLQATRDATLYESIDGEIANGSGEYLFSGRTDQGLRRRALLFFDVSSIPPGSVINSVSLSLHLSRTSTGNQPVTLHRALAGWGEGASDATGNEGPGAAAEANDATWLHRFYNTTLWTNQGGDFQAPASASATVGNALTFYTWTSAGMASDVLAWVNNPLSNFGWLARGNEAAQHTVKRFDSRQHVDPALRPMLTVNFTPSGPTGACCAAAGGCSITTPAGCAFQGGTYQGDAIPCSPDPCAAPTGACCFPGGFCDVITKTDCLSKSGLYQGDAASCSPNPCTPATGACCLPSGLCLADTATGCAGQGGAYQGDGIACAPELCPVFLTPFVDALPIPAVAIPDSGKPGGAAAYTLAMTEFEQTLHRDLPPTRVWGYAGSYPGPTILATAEQPVTITWLNDLRDAKGIPRTSHYLPVDPCPHGASDEPRTVVHMHGAHVAADADGYPEDAFLPGQSLTYLYPNDQLPAALWYHDHALGLTRLNVYMGLAGFYLLRDAFEQSLGLPSGPYEVPLAIQDRTFNPDGSLHYHAMWDEHFFGDKMLVNGKVWPYLDVARGKYRFRVLNGCNSRTLALAFSDGAAFSILGMEGGLLPAPVSVSQITLGPAERADLIIDFGAYAAGTELLLVNSAPAPYPGSPGVGILPDVMKFIVTDSAGHTAPVPPVLRPMTPLQESQAVRSRELVLAKHPEACAGAHWLINDLGWMDLTEFPRIGTTEIWSFINRSGVSHPMHIHLVHFLVLDRQDFDTGNPTLVPIGPRVPPAAGEAGWKDTVMAHPGQITRVIARFDGFTGLFAYHCHVLEHEDHEMMRQFRVVRLGDHDTDGDVDTADFTALADCLEGPAVVPAPPAPATPEGCLQAFDAEYDGDVDLVDFAAIQREIPSI